MPRTRRVDDLERLQGVWSITAIELDGQDIASPGARIIIKGTDFSTEGMGAGYQGKVSLDPGAKPKGIDLQFTAGPEEGNRNLGIYELKDDTWKLCLDMTGKARPTKFASGPGVALETLQRGVADTAGRTPKVPGDLPSGGPTDDIQGEWALVSLVADGMTVPASMTRYGKRVATAGEITVTIGPQVIVKARYSVNRDTHPNTIDYLTEKGLQYGIFEVNGTILKTCFAPPGQSRPGAFQAGKEDRHTLTEWKKL